MLRSAASLLAEFPRWRLVTSGSRGAILGGFLTVFEWQGSFSRVALRFVSIKSASGNDFMSISGGASCVLSRWGTLSSRRTAGVGTVRCYWAKIQYGVR